MSRKGGAHSTSAEIGGSSGITAEDFAGIGLQDFNCDDIGGPSESWTCDVGSTVGMDSDLNGATTDVIVFSRRKIRCTQRCQHICSCAVLEDVSAEIEADGTKKPSPVLLGRDGGRANGPDRELFSCTRCGRA